MIVNIEFYGVNTVAFWAFFLFCLTCILNAQKNINRINL